jgi:myo-inositol-1(or 4)-monophosphatase
MPEINDHELADIYAFAVQLGKDAGQMLMAAIQRRIEGDSSGNYPATALYLEKENSVDIVTQTDNSEPF